jgi:hypothetical protein
VIEIGGLEVFQRTPRTEAHRELLREGLQDHGLQVRGVLKEPVDGYISSTGTRGIGECRIGEVASVDKKFTTATQQVMKESWIEVPEFGFFAGAQSGEHLGVSLQERGKKGETTTGHFFLCPGFVINTVGPADQLP